MESVILSLVGESSHEPLDCLTERETHGERVKGLTPSLLPRPVKPPAGCRDPHHLPPLEPSAHPFPCSSNPPLFPDQDSGVQTILRASYES
ncbi:hypothetical protein NQZ68_038622 [Dissostichus eleginoides]|nr:hypothetical protein NQZ68_038622 [Dissostichus eleginoides]